MPGYEADDTRAFIPQALKSLGILIRMDHSICGSATKATFKKAVLDVSALTRLRASVIQSSL